MPENGMRGSDATTASQRQIESAAHAVAGNCRIDRSREVLDRAHQRLTHLREFVSGRTIESRNLLQVGSGGKESFVACDHQRPRLAVAKFCKSLRSGQGHNSRVSRLVPSSRLQPKQPRSSLNLFKFEIEVVNM